MDNEQAFATFDRWPLGNSSERLRAARFLARNATEEHRARLSKIRGVERNSWIRGALDQAIRRSERSIRESSVASSGAIEKIPEQTAPDARLNEEHRAQAIEETTALFLHELRPLVGSLEVAAARELGCYARSRTKTSVDRVKSFLDAIERLRIASAPPAIQEFDLTDLVVRAADNEVTRGRATLDDFKEEQNEATALTDESEREQPQSVIRLSFTRRDSGVTMGDPMLIELAVTNALRNAIESVLRSQEPIGNGVVLNWGVTDADSWIVVLDEGLGLPTGLDHLTDPGVTTKSRHQGHLGMGLPIAKRAVESIRGSLQLSPRPGGGASCEIRWPREGLEE